MRLAAMLAALLVLAGAHARSSEEDQCLFLEDEDEGECTSYVYNWVSMDIKDPSFFGPNTGIVLAPLRSHQSVAGLNWDIELAKRLTDKHLKVERLEMWRQSPTCSCKVLDQKRTSYCSDPTPEVTACAQLFGFPYGGFVQCPFEQDRYSLTNFKRRTLSDVFKKGEYFIKMGFSWRGTTFVVFSATVTFS